MRQSRNPPCGNPQLARVVAVRDSKDRQGPVLTFAPNTRRSFLAYAKQR
ncbi:DUF397 domain-containing protein [Micromonospora qiuiae]|nr:DUF397 domain-containing protein [Micromonospora qiuiae]